MARKKVKATDVVNQCIENIKKNMDSYADIQDVVDVYQKGQMKVIEDIKKEFHTLWLNRVDQMEVNHRGFKILFEKDNICITRNPQENEEEENGKESSKEDNQEKTTG